MTAWRTLLIAVPGLTALLLSACDGIPESVRTEGRRLRLSKAGVQTFDSAGGFYRVGMSAVADIELEPLRKRDLRGDTVGEAYHLFLARCGACHDVPAPGSKDAPEWATTLTRMRENIEQAGLLPMSDHEGELIGDFLRRHGR